MKNTNDNPLTLSVYVTCKERLAVIVRALAEVKDIWELCGVMTDIYEKELAGLDDKNTIIASRNLIMSIIPLLKNYKGSISVKSIQGGIYKYVIHKEVNLKKIQESKTLTAYVTDEERKEKIKKALAEVTNYKDLCLGVIGNIYNNELAGISDRDKIVVSLPFVRSIVPCVKNLEGSRICNVRNIRKGIDHYLFGKKRDKGKKTVDIDNKKVYSTGRSPQRPIAKPLMDYIADENRKKEIALALSKVEDAKTLCLKVINDVYETELAVMEDREKIIVSKRFIESMFPYMDNYRGRLTERNIYAAIRKYVIFGDEREID